MDPHEKNSTASVSYIQDIINLHLQKGNNILLTNTTAYMLWELDLQERSTCYQIMADQVLIEYNPWTQSYNLPYRQGIDNNNGILQLASHKYQYPVVLVL